MELTPLLFLGFFAAVALLNYTLPRVLRPYCLLAASYLFYCWGATDRLLVPVLVSATLVTWGCGLVIGHGYPAGPGLPIPCCAQLHH